MQTKFHEFFFISGLRQAVMSNNHRSATVSPSSENSPSTEGGGGGHGHAPHPRSGGGYAQYSSQDSLPDSPYSSQSLDSQPAPGQGSLCTSLHTDFRWTLFKEKCQIREIRIFEIFFVKSFVKLK